MEIFGGHAFYLSIRNERMDFVEGKIIVMEHGQFSWLSVLFDHQGCHKRGGYNNRNGVR